MKWRADARRLTSPAGNLLTDLKEDDLLRARVIQDWSDSRRGVHVVEEMFRDDSLQKDSGTGWE